MRKSPFSPTRVGLAWIGAGLIVACLCAAPMVGCGSSSAPADATSYPPMIWTPGQTVVSIEFDDAIAEQFGVRSILSSHKIKATFFINSGNLFTDYHMTWSQVHQLYSEGNEIAGHTVMHQHLTQLSTDEARREICNDRTTLLNQRFPVTDFAYPYGDYNSTIKSLARECGYDSARDVNGVRSPSCEEIASCPYAESIPPHDPYQVRTPQNILDTDTLANIEGYVTQAQQHGGGWVQLVFHHICNKCDTYAVTSSDFSEFINWLVTQKSTSTATVQQVLGGPLQPAFTGPTPVNLPGPNLLHNPSLEESSNGAVPDGWDTTTYGNNAATFTRTTDAHSGSYAEHVEVTNFRSGSARLFSHFDLGQYAPTATVGEHYDASAYYKSTVPAQLSIYTRDRIGEWNFWTNGPPLPASSSWAQARFTTPKIPSGVTGISIGLGIQQAGSVTMDDFSLSTGA